MAWPHGFLLGGGQLIVSNIVTASLAEFTVTGGTINQSGTLTAANADLYFGSGTWQFGPLQLSSAAHTNSTIHLASASVKVQFGDSHSLGWSNPAKLVIENWSGSLYGGGAQPILFGNNAGALNVPQLKQVQCHNPVNRVAGTNPARILATGEIIPDAFFSGQGSEPSDAVGRAARLRRLALGGEKNVLNRPQAEILHGQHQGTFTAR